MRNKKETFFEMFIGSGVIIFLLSLFSFIVTAIVFTLTGTSWSWMPTFTTVGITIFCTLGIFFTFTTEVVLEDKKLDNFQEGDSELENPDDDSDLWK